MLAAEAAAAAEHLQSLRLAPAAGLSYESAHNEWKRAAELVRKGVASPSSPSLSSSSSKSSSKNRAVSSIRRSRSATAAEDEKADDDFDDDNDDDDDDDGEGEEGEVGAGGAGELWSRAGGSFTACEQDLVEAAALRFGLWPPPALGGRGVDHMEKGFAAAMEDIVNTSAASAELGAGAAAGEPWGGVATWEEEGAGEDAAATGHPCFDSDAVCLSVLASLLVRCRGLSAPAPSPPSLLPVAVDDLVAVLERALEASEEGETSKSHTGLLLTLRLLLAVECVTPESQSTTPQGLDDLSTAMLQQQRVALLQERLEEVRIAIQSQARDSSELLLLL